MCVIKQHISEVVSDIRKTLDSGIDDGYRDQLEKMESLLLQALRPEATTRSAMSILKVARYYVIDWRLLDREGDIGDRIWNLCEAYEQLAKRSNAEESAT